MESYLKENFGEVKPKHSSEEVLQRWRDLFLVKNPKRWFRFTANLSKRFEAAAMRRTNQSILEPDISSDSDSVNDVTFGTPSWSPTESPGADGTLTVSVASSPTTCSVPSGQGPPTRVEIPAPLSPRGSLDAGGTLRVSVVSSPTSSSVEAGQCPPRIFGVSPAMGLTRTTPAATEAGAIHPRGPLTSPPRIDGVSAGRSPTRKISEDPESGEVRPRGPPTSPVVDLMEILMKHAELPVSLLALLMEIAHVFFPNNKILKLAVVMLTSINCLITWIEFVRKAKSRGARFAFPYFILPDEQRYGCIVDYLDMYAAIPQMGFLIASSIKKLTSHVIGILGVLLLTAIFCSKLTVKFHGCHSY